MSNLIGWWQHRDRIVPALPGTIFLPSPGKIDALAGRQATHIECGDMEAEAAVAARFVRRLAPTAPSPMHDGWSRQRDRESRAGEQTVDRRVQPPEGMPGRRAAGPVAPPDGARSVHWLSELARN